MTKEEVLEKINRVKFWYHRIDLGDGICTAGPSGINRFDRYGFTDELRGKAVLDIGAWDGLESFKSEQFGARRVVATDVWRDAPFLNRYWSTIRNGDEGFRCAKEILRSQVEQLNIDVFELSEKTVGKFDIVFFLGVLYHVQHPLKALQIISGICNEMLVIETAVLAPGGIWPDECEKVPIMQLRGEAGWFPNRLCVREMLKLAGFRRIDHSLFKGVGRTDRDSRFGMIRRDTDARGYDPRAQNSLQVPAGTPVEILNTELGNMDLAHPRAGRVRIQWGSPKRQAWIDKAVVEIVDHIPEELDVNKLTKTERIILRAYK